MHFGAGRKALDLFVARQFSPLSTLFNDPPFVVGNIVGTATSLDLADQKGNPFLLLLGPSEHPVQNRLT
jgi:hypothetical protein